MPAAPEEKVAAAKSIRHFNRYYTNRLGLLARYRFDTKLTLTEARALFEIGRRGAHTQGALGAGLKIDGGYLNRVVGRLVDWGLVARRQDEGDGRVVVLELTEEGRLSASRIDEASDAEASSLLEGLGEAEARELVDHMRAIERLLEGLGTARPVVELAERGAAIASARVLMREYLESLGEDLGYQGIEDELAGLPGKYAAPRGALFIASLGSPRDADAHAAAESAGCIALRPLEGDACEMKRLFVRPEYRGYGIGRALAQRAIGAARDLGYRRMRLDTLERLEDAVRLYEALGFERIEPYCENPLPGAMFWEKSLAG
jgi:putative acetyltransferase